MSHQTGIQANEELRKFFAKCKEGDIRLVKISIKDEQLVLDTYKEASNNDWEHDYDKLVLPLLEENQPCYIVYRFDTKNSLGFEWILVSWSPDTAPVRQKMLYASTKATLKQEFGTSQIKEELHGTTMGDVTLNGYIKYKKNMNAPAPLSMREEELKEIKRTEINMDYNVNSKQETFSGVDLRISQSAEQAIVDMARGSYDYVQFKIDLDEETIHLVSAENIPLEKLPSKIPEDRARYHLYKFKHTHEGDYMESFVFIYSMPGYSCPVKERMLYSCNANTLRHRISLHGIDISKKLEIDSGSELTEAFLYEEIHPTKNLHRPKFEKPKGPANRGPKRLTKSQNN